MILSYIEWLNIHKNSVHNLYIHLLNQNIELFNNNNCSFNKFTYFCYKNSSKDKLRYL